MGIAEIYLLVGLILVGLYCIWDTPRDVTDASLAIIAVAVWPAFLIIVLVLHIQNTDFGGRR